MATFLLYDDAVRSPEMRHEIAEPIGDPVIFIDHEGERIVVASTLEAGTFRKREDIVDRFWDYDELGWHDLVREGSLDRETVGAEVVLRALGKLGVTAAVVPPTFRILVADYLREKGIQVTVDADAWSARRRRKTPWELEGIERAQRAAETAMLSAARMLRDAERTSEGKLRFEGEILTAEWIREVMVADLLSQGAESEEILVQPGDQCLDGHGLGHGPILPDQSVIIDCFPRDRRTGAYTDMTRTFVAGRPSDELLKLYRDVREATDLALEATRPGVDDLFHRVSNFFHEKGYPTRLHGLRDGRPTEGFPYGLGHGVGLQVHERPSMGLRSDPLAEGDVVAIEPGLYFGGVGGVRLEDTVLVTADGAERFTDPFPYELEP